MVVFYILFNNQIKYIITTHVSYDTDRGTRIYRYMVRRIIVMLIIPLTTQRILISLSLHISTRAVCG